MKSQLIISIGRSYGSGGHEIGKKLAEKLDIEFYDRNLLDEIANVSNSNYDELAKYDEKPKSPLFSRTVRGYTNSPEVNVAELQFALLKSKAADADSFVICGRCSDTIFEGLAPCVSIFISANKEDRINRITELRNMTTKEALKKIEKHDKRRAAYHDYYCKGKWGHADAYDLCINSSTLGLDGTIDFLYNYITSFVDKK